MKRIKNISLVILFFTIIAFPLKAMTDNEMRKTMIDSQRLELLSLAQKEVPQGSLGEWKNIIDSSLFLLFRRTELFRGQMRVLVIDSPFIEVKMYPEGTFVISTALLDYIDTTLFEDTAESPRRIRYFDSERESLLFPFLVPEAAHFALDHSFSAYKRNGSNSGLSFPTSEEVLEADRFSVILLKIAGIDPSILDSWFVRLKGVTGSETGKTVFSRYLANLPSSEIRAESIALSREKILQIANEFSAVLGCLRTGTAFAEATSSLAAIREIYPESNYITRLEALTLHRQWLSTVDPSVQQIKTFFPIADEEDPSQVAFMSLFAVQANAFPSPNFMATHATIPGNNKMYINALDAYKKVIDTYSDSALVSSYAMLLIWSGNKDIRKMALKTGETAALGETNTSCITARANYASLLYLTGTDYVKAQYVLSLLEREALGTVAEPEPNVFLDQGFPGDGRDILLNSALILRSLGDTKPALEKKEKLESLLKTQSGPGSLSLRFVHTGDTVDEMIAKWGRPAEILYNYYTENWEYPSLSTSVLVIADKSNSTTQKIRLIRIGSLSPITIGNDIRTGDKREEFEKQFGKRMYRSGDCDVYLQDGNRISVFYLQSKIRRINVGL